MHGSGVETDIAVMGPEPLKGETLARHGLSHGKRVIFVLAEVEAPRVRLGLSAAVAGSGRYRDLISGKVVEFATEGRRNVGDVELSRWRMALLVEEKSPSG